MSIAKLIALLGILAMAIALANGFVNGDFSGEGSLLLAMPWGIVSFVDLYVGFTLFSGWIIYREGWTLKAGVWVLLMMVLGFFTGALYTFLALQSSGGDWAKFWLGQKAKQA
jgi:hypothetical protein